MGNVKNPLTIGNKGEIMDLLDSEFFLLLDKYRWFRSGMLKVDVNKEPAYLSTGIRAFSEVDNGRR